MRLPQPSVREGWALGSRQATYLVRKNQTIQYVYDALNRLSSKTYPDQGSANYVYDLVGRIQQVTDPTGTYVFAYDNMGRLIGTSTQYTFLAGPQFPEPLHLRRGLEPDGTAGARRKHEYLQLRHAEPADDADQLADRAVRFWLRCTEPEDAANAAERYQHELQLRWGIAPAERAASSGIDHARRGQLRLRPLR